MNTEIARRLETALRNVKNDVSRQLIKTATSSRSKLVRHARMQAPVV
jgi:DNA-binding NarL/FixJ family response regulator